jgi:hypothetical protein
MIKEYIKLLIFEATKQKRMPKGNNKIIRYYLEVYNLLNKNQYTMEDIQNLILILNNFNESGEIYKIIKLLKLISIGSSTRTAYYLNDEYILKVANMNGYGVIGIIYETDINNYYTMYPYIPKIIDYDKTNRDWIIMENVRLVKNSADLLEWVDKIGLNCIIELMNIFEIDIKDLVYYIKVFFYYLSSIKIKDIDNNIDLIRIIDLVFYKKRSSEYYEKFNQIILMNSNKIKKLIYEFEKNDFVIKAHTLGIGDFHANNLGFSKDDGRPLILDWEN